ncbi:hypothetical protein LP419_12545 [Massilia sp. H-1]|nr:hypothetical protein LP419_12545 [Massilia sp. H-1]
MQALGHAKQNFLDYDRTGVRVDPDLHHCTLNLLATPQYSRSAGWRHASYRHAIVRPIQCLAGPAHNVFSKNTFLHRSSSFVAFAAPFFMLTERQGLALGGVPTIIASALAVLLFGLAYFHFALSGHNIVRSRRLRQVAAALILFQLGAGGWLLHVSGNPQTLVAVAPLMCFSVLLFLAFVWPGDNSHTHRRMPAAQGRQRRASATLTIVLLTISMLCSRVCTGEMHGKGAGTGGNPLLSTIDITA